MIVMPANSTGWFWHCLAHGTGKLGHLYSPGAQRGPWPWFPYALDNGVFSCWDPVANTFDEAKWAQVLPKWRELIFWAQAAPIKPRWAIVPDVPGNGTATLERYAEYAKEVSAAGIPLAIAVQDGMTSDDVWDLDLLPEVICVGGSTEWKWESAWLWAHDFPRCHLLRCNSPEKLPILEEWGFESSDGTGWNRGDRKQTSGLEKWCRIDPRPSQEPLWPHVSRKTDPRQSSFA